MRSEYEKPYIVITSLGRTGTRFFGEKMGEVIEDCKSVHEPDVMSLDSPRELFCKIKEHGPINMTVGKFSPKYSLRSLSIARQRGVLSDENALKYIRSIRGKTLKKIKSSVFLEANLQLSALMDLFPKVFINVRIAYIVRDPRTWISSWFNNGGPFYSFLDLRSWFRNMRVTSNNIDGDSYKNKWKEMSRFEKLCWLWRVENSYALNCAENTNAVKLFRYEDIFNESENYESLIQMLEFLTAFPNGYNARWNLKRELLGEHVNTKKRNVFPQWSEWGVEQSLLLDKHCGELMRRFGYGNELDWQKKMRQSDMKIPVGEE